jgi:GNAT superfamily N-acetyltransferase
VWRRLRLTALAESPHAFGARLADWQGDGDREDRWRQWLSRPNSVTVVAVANGEPTGMACGVCADSCDIADVYAMWVAPKARRGGAGAALIAAVEAWAGGLGVRTLRLQVADGNAAAAAFYARVGFTDTGRTGEPMPDGRGTRHLSKPITSSR